MLCICGEIAKNRGYCVRHHSFLWHLGVLRARTVEECFFEKAHQDGDCWVWTGASTSNGYPLFRNSVAHRWSYEFLRDEIPEGLHLDHLCRNTMCVNPWHLEPVTQAENNRRSVEARFTGVCPVGHAYDDRNMYRTPRGHLKCRRCRADGEARRRARAA